MDTFTATIRLHVYSFWSSHSHSRKLSERPMIQMIKDICTRTHVRHRTGRIWAGADLELLPWALALTVPEGAEQAAEGEKQSIPTSLQCLWTTGMTRMKTAWKGQWNCRWLRAGSKPEQMEPGWVEICSKTNFCSTRKREAVHWHH